MIKIIKIFLIKYASNLAVKNPIRINFHMTLPTPFKQIYQILTRHKIKSNDKFLFHLENRVSIFYSSKTNITQPHMFSRFYSLINYAKT